MGLLIMMLGVALFVGVHAFVTFRDERARAIAQWGEGPYKIAFSLASLAGIVLMAYGFGLYRATAWIPLWNPPAWTRHLAVLLMLPAVILIVAAYVPGHIKQRVRHPMLAGVKLWALAHLIANGDLGSLLLFGSLLAWAVYDRIAVKRREAVGEVPPAKPVAGWSNDGIAIAAGGVLYLLLGLIFHPLVIGVPAFSG
jgi:uncharacterized membrane protein